MKWSRLALVLLLALAGSVFAVPRDWTGERSALAQEQAVTLAVTPVNDTEALPADTEGPVLGQDELPWFLTALLMFGILAFAILFLYLYKTQHRFYGVFSGLAGSGQAPDVVSVSPFTGSGQPGTLAGPSPAPLPVVSGPGVVTVGVQSDEFTVALQDTPVEDAQWSVTPATAAALNPMMGARIRVIATLTGAFELTATVPGSGATASVQVAAIAPERSNGNLPFVGSGFGSIAVTILLVVGVTALAFNGSLGGEAVATLFGGLLGYVFGAAAPGSRSSGNK
jgi:hypothetical protein